jgi:putative flippase GtrA
LLDRVLEIRFLKFGTVGAFRTLITVGVLFLGQEYAFRAIQSVPMRLNASLGMAVFSLP